MSEENQGSQEEKQGEDTTEVTNETLVETQQSVPETEVDTATEISTNTAEVGLQKPEVTEDEDSQDIGGELNTLVAQALAGELSEEARAELDKSGIGAHFDMIVSGHKAQQAANDQEIYSVVGSKEGYTELQEWAVSKLSDSEIASFNHAVLKSGDIGLAKLAVEGLQARYARENGQAPSKVIEAGGTANEQSRPFSDVQTYINETMTVKYKTDPEYAAQVEAKRNASGF